MTTTENHDQQKAQISFKTITLTKKILVLRNTRPQELNQEIFLSNISYVGISKEDFYNQNFVFDIYALRTKNLNLFPLERKLWDLNKHEIIYMLWKECMPADFHKYVCLEGKFFYRKRKNVLYSKVSEIICKFIQNDEKNTTSSGITCVSLKTFFNTFILMYILRCIVQLKEEVLI